MVVAHVGHDLGFAEQPRQGHVLGNGEVDSSEHDNRVSRQCRPDDPDVPPCHQALAVAGNFSHEVFTLR